MKVGDLVKHSWCHLGLGILVDWYDAENEYAIVRWRTTENPCHISKLILVSGDSMIKENNVEYV